MKNIQQQQQQMQLQIVLFNTTKKRQQQQKRTTITNKAALEMTRQVKRKERKGKTTLENICILHMYVCMYVWMCEQVCTICNDTGAQAQYKTIEKKATLALFNGKTDNATIFFFSLFHFNYFTIR